MFAFVRRLCFLYHDVGLVCPPNDVRASDTPICGLHAHCNAVLFDPGECPCLHYKITNNSTRFTFPVASRKVLVGCILRVLEVLQYFGANNSGSDLIRPP